MVVASPVACTSPHVRRPASGVRRHGAVLYLAFTENNAIEMYLSGPNYVGHCIVKFLAAGLASGDAATMKRARNNRWKRMYRRETYEVDLPPHCVRRRASKMKSCHVGRHQRHRPGCAIPLVVGVVPECGERREPRGRRTLSFSLSLFGFIYAPRRAKFSGRACARLIYQGNRCECVREYRRNCEHVGGYVCVVSTHMIQRIHPRVE